VDALLYERVSYEQHAAVWPQLEEQFGDYAVRMNTIPKLAAAALAGRARVRRVGRLSHKRRL
jgi:hypothetical protein